MQTRNPKREIEFLSGRKGTFRFECEACGRCCGEYTILLTPYDIIRLRRATGKGTGELIRGGTIRITRMPFKKAFGFAPVADMFEMFGVSQHDVVPVAMLGFRSETLGETVCEFLSPPEDGKRLCTIYEHRPGMCRLHPLGCVTVGGRRRWFYRQPLCEPDEGKPQTVEQWLRESRMRPYMDANARYLRWMQELLENSERLDNVTERQWKEFEKILFDFDSIKSITKRVNIDIIEENLRKWLARTFSRK